MYLHKTLGALAVVVAFAAILISGMFVSYGQGNFQGNMSMDKQHYYVDEREPRSIMAWIEYLNHKNGVDGAIVVPPDQWENIFGIDKATSQQWLFQLESDCAPDPGLGILVDMYTRAMIPLCWRQHPAAAAFRELRGTVMMEKFGWKYMGFFDGKHKFSLATANRNA